MSKNGPDNRSEIFLCTPRKPSFMCLPSYHTRWPKIHDFFWTAPPSGRSPNVDGKAGRIEGGTVLLTYRRGLAFRPAG